MPAIWNCTQTLTTVNDKVTIKVKYTVFFSPLERHLASKGLKFRERIRVIGEDVLPGADQVLHTFPIEYIPVSAGAERLQVERNRSITVLRSTLQEDPGLGDADDIRCSIEIAPIGLPIIITASTPVGTLLG